MNRLARMIWDVRVPRAPGPGLPSPTRRILLVRTFG